MDDNEVIAKYKKYEPLFGSWRINRFIGEGSFAQVFELVRNDFGGEYAAALKVITVSKTRTEIESMKAEGMTEGEIKESLRGIVEDTAREIRLMYKLKGNGNIVEYEDHAVMEHEDGWGFDILIKMEYLTTLGSYIRQQKGSLAEEEIIRLGIDICKALEACQKYNIIHRDIKADNIFISQNGDFKLGDFGFAKVMERKDMEMSKKGTSAYMAPEVYKGQNYDTAADIYSLGIVLYRLLNNNRAPFLPKYPEPISLDDRDVALLRRMSGEKFPKPAQAPGGRLAEIVMKACAYHPRERYESPMAMRRELEALLAKGNGKSVMIYEDREALQKEPTDTGISGREEKEEKPEKKPLRTGAEKSRTIKGICAVLILAVVLGTAILAGFLISTSGRQNTKNVETMGQEPVLMGAEPQSVYFLNTGIRRGEIGSVTFLDTLADMPRDAEDVSAAGNGTVMAWAVQGENGYYDVYIGGEGGVWLGTDASGLFAYLINAEEIRLGDCVHTEYTESMQEMFLHCRKVTGLDVSGFDTAGVSDMSSMFSGCRLLSAVDVSRFDTGSLKKTTGMFADCPELERPDMENFAPELIEDMGF